jgi:alkanesulfonate monooxygenase SsuD/methylene tetrahydromethanopterin reductase-like flavin-dependent oxidoreductase (luciferase family)
MDFGVFLGPWHRAGQDPTLALERDLELIALLDALGYTEAWIGEHHSAGWEIIADPAVFIAAAAQRTRHIRLGTGVTSLPYHHPLMVADRMVLLDHLTRGRVMLGVGPGSLPSDAFMMGIDPMTQRERMEESLEAIVALLTSPERVTRSTEWFELRDRRRCDRLASRAPCRGTLRIVSHLHRRHHDARLRRVVEPLAGDGRASGDPRDHAVARSVAARWPDAHRRDRGGST